MEVLLWVNIKQIFGFSEIIVDGHTCIQEQPGVYKVTDDYRVNEEDWFNNSQNKDLFAMTLYDENETEHKVLYICEDTIDSHVAAAKLMPKGVMHISMICSHTGLCENALFTILQWGGFCYG